MMTVSSFNELIPVAHGMAKQKGWWPQDKKRSEMEIFNNFHSEVSEAWEESRSGRMLPWHESDDPECATNRKCYGYEDLDGFDPTKKAEGFGVELADFVIRVADWYGSLGFDGIEDREEDIDAD